MNKNLQSRLTRKRLASILSALFGFLLVQLAHAYIAKATVWYFRDSSQSLPSNPPTAHQTTDSFSYGVFQGRLMTLTQGGTSETRNQAIASGNTGYWMNTTFLSDAIGSSQTFIAGQTWSVRIWVAVDSGSKLVIYPKIYIYEWIPGTGRGDVFLNPTQGASDINSNSLIAYDITSNSGLAGTLDAGNYLCVDVYWNVTSVTAARTVTSAWGDATYDSKLTSPGTEVPTLGWPLLLAAVSFLTFFMIKKGKLSPRMGLVTLFLLLVLVFGGRLTPQGNPILASSWQDMQATSVIGPKGKGYALRPISLNSSNSSPHASEPGGARR